MNQVFVYFKYDRFDYFCKVAPNLTDPERPAGLTWEELIHYVWLGPFGSVIKVVRQSGPLMHGSGRLLITLGTNCRIVVIIPRLLYLS